MTDFLTLQNVSKRYGSAKALDDVSLTIGRGDFVTLLGPSGSGKSTALMAIAGFLEIDRGSVTFEGRDITRLKPEARGFGIVFQGYALFPHMTAAENIAYPLRVRRMAKAEITDRVKRVLDMVHLEPFAHRKPTMLSGGQQQRVAIARALVYEPPLLLLDEPLSALDRKLRGELQDGLKELHGRLGTTFVNVTHDQEEALSLSTSVVVLSGGRVMQQASPDDIYDRPATTFVADFIGSANLLRLSDLRREGSRTVGVIGGQEVSFVERHGRAGSVGVLAVRPEALQVGTVVPPDWNALSGTVVSRDRTGMSVLMKVEVPSHGVVRVLCPVGAAPALAVGEKITLSWPMESGVHVLDSDLT
jgi:putative spermidine/putrescine transport system ATP-binding protein